MHHPVWEGYFQLYSSLQPLCSVSHSPGTDEQLIAGQRHPVLVDKPSSARAVVQMKEASSHSWEASKWDQLSEVDRPEVVWEQTCTTI